MTCGLGNREDILATAENSGTCADSQSRLGAFLGALAAGVAPTAPDLAAVLSAWQNLPEPVKAGILAMVKAVKRLPMANER